MQFPTLAALSLMFAAFMLHAQATPAPVPDPAPIVPCCVIINGGTERICIGGKQQLLLLGEIDIEDDIRQISLSFKGEQVYGRRSWDACSSTQEIGRIVTMGCALGEAQSGVGRRAGQGGGGRRVLARGGREASLRVRSERTPATASRVAALPSYSPHDSEEPLALQDPHLSSIDSVRS
ncbi:hypothetical protein B0H19DRAFT_1247475 [Mycena capillaripes]|nr:hypothetical protein B0H19DRAFT_1247475 [Mycena capillaripes]